MKRRISYLLIIFATIVIVLLVARPATAAGPQWFAQYWPNTEQSGVPAVTRYEEIIDYNWGYGSPAPQIPDNYFSARWTRTLRLAPGTYRFTTKSDDGVRVTIGGTVVINNYTAHALQTNSVDVILAGAAYDIQVDYYEWTERAAVGLEWKRVALPATSVPFGPVGVGGIDETVATVKNIVNYLNVYYTPSGAFTQIVGRLINGEQVALTGMRTQSGAYVQVRLPTGAIGWVPSGYLEVPFAIGDLTVMPDDTTGPVGSMPTAPMSATATVASARMYVHPGDYYGGITGWLNLGEKVELIGFQTYDGVYVLVRRSDGSEGWVAIYNLQGSVPFHNLAVWIGPT